MSKIKIRFLVINFAVYRQWITKKGKEWIDSCFETYPIIDFTIEGDD